jgi:poly(ADP-ribose) glycohydrolase ARH3
VHSQGLSRGVFEAVLLAVAIGDSLGLEPERSWPEPSPGWLEEPPLPRCALEGGVCPYSDDTEMTLILAESIAERCGVDEDHVAMSLAARASVEDEVRYYGAGTTAVLKMIRKGVDWRRASREVYEGGNLGNGGAIRVAPVALFYYPDLHSTLDAAGRQSVVTHSHPLGVEAARIQAAAIHYSLSGLEPERLPDVLASHASSNEFRARLEAAASLLEGEASPPDVARIIGNGVEGYESVPAAVYAHARARGDPAKAVAYALSLGGDADSIASMAASIAAAYAGGLGGLEGLTRILEGYERIVETAGRLYEAYTACGGGRT